jgi:hypothetical protein
VRTVRSLFGGTGKKVGGKLAKIMINLPKVRAKNYRAVVDWGDGTVEQVKVVKSGKKGLIIEGNHRYAAPGNYTGTLTLSDMNGNSASTTFAVTVG